MSWGQRGLIAIVVVGLCALWGVGWANAKTHQYEVSYFGSGHYSAKTETSVACGLEKRDETTNFSWGSAYLLELSFGRHGFGAVHTTTQPEPKPRTDNTASVSFSGCAGTANCHGESQPAPQNPSTFDSSAAAPSGRSKFRVGGVGSEGFKPLDFSGTWNAGDPGSCSAWASTGTLVTQEFNVTAEVLAVFPVKYATLKRLPLHHYFNVHIAPGHYAQRRLDTCQPSDGCESEAFDWSGVVKVKRLT